MTDSVIERIAAQQSAQLGLRWPVFAVFKGNANTLCIQFRDDGDLHLVTLVGGYHMDKENLGREIKRQLLTMAQVRSRL